MRKSFNKSLGRKKYVSLLCSGLTISADITVDLIALGNVDLLFVVVVVVGTVVVVFGGGLGCDDGVENSFYTK